MKTATFILGLLLVASLSWAQPLLLPVAAPASVPVVAEPSLRPELNQLREQLDAIRRSNQEVTQKWEALADENNALSNRLADLQQALLAQKDRELDLARQSHAFNMKLLGAAALGIVLVVMLSYWFQLRCFNRVIEVTRSLPAYQTPALLEQETSAGSKLLDAVKLLETRIQQLELPRPATPDHSVPAIQAAPASTETATASLPKPEPDDVAPAGPMKAPKADPEPPGPQPANPSLLLAKGQVLLDMDRLQEAVSCFQEAVALDPQNAEAHFKKGIAWERMNRLELALEAYEDTLKLNPKRAAAQVYKARVLQALHRYDEALSVYDSALTKPAPKNGSATLAN